MDRSEQKTIKKFGKSSSGRSHGLHNFFRAAIYMAHRAVIFAIALLSCNKKRQLPVWLVNYRPTASSAYCFSSVQSLEVKIDQS